MKKLFATIAIALLISTSLNLNVYADSFYKTNFVSNGECELKQKFRVKKGEYVKLGAINKARGGITFIVEDMEGNIISTPLSLNSGIDEPTKKEVEIDLPKGEYVLKAQGKLYRNSNVFTGNKLETEKTNGYFKVKLKTLKYKR